MMKCNKCAAKAFVLATTTLPDGTCRRRYECSAHPVTHRFTIKGGAGSRPYRVKDRPVAFWPHPLLTEWRPSPWGTACA